MKSFKIIIVCAAVLMPAQSAWSYQVTGPVLETTATKIVVQKGKDKWELARTADTKASAEVKVGDKVTIEYTMSATDISVKSPKKK